MSAVWDMWCNTPFTPPNAKPVNDMLLAFENIITKFPYNFYKKKR